MGAFCGSLSAQTLERERRGDVGPARTRETTQRRVFVDTPAPETKNELDEVVILVQQEYMQRQTVLADFLEPSVLVEYVAPEFAVNLETPAPADACSTPATVTEYATHP